MTATPAPPAHCYDHQVYERTCFACQGFYREQLAEIRQAERPVLEVVPGPAAESGPRSPTPRGADRGPSGRNRSDLHEHPEIVVRGSEWSADHSDRPRTGPGPVPDHGDQRAGTDSEPVDYRRYFDVAALLAGELPEPPAPAYGMRDDQRALFYAGEVNLVFGDPESGKTWLALVAARELLGEFGDGRVLVIDLDHNGPGPTVVRLLALGADRAALADPERFLYVEPEDRLHLAAIVADMRTWRPNVVVLDSLGELLPLFGSSSNSADEYTNAHRSVLKPLTKTGAAVLVIDHLAKGTESRTLGPGGTAAKRRTIGGVSLRVTVNEAFTPGKGGSAWLTVNKDRHGGLRQHCPAGGKEPSAGLFRLDPHASLDGVLEPIIRAPAEGDRVPVNFGIAVSDSGRVSDDVAALDALDPAPTSKRDVQDRMGWGGSRANAALKAWRDREDGGGSDG